MNLGAFADSILGIPLQVKWALAIIGVAIGLPLILGAEAIVRGLRKWLLFQLRLVRRPGYRRMLKIYGWLLFGSGVLLMGVLRRNYGG